MGLFRITGLNSSLPLPVSMLASKLGAKIGAGSINTTTIRHVHHKESKHYPKVNIEDVELEKPRYGFRKERPPLLSQEVTDSIFSSEAIRKKYMKLGKPVPIKYRSHGDKIARRNLEKYAEEVATGQPHFKVGENQVYLPKGKVCLLRPGAKHSPYQAKFLVPRNFNKLDLRDYLWHVYGLRATNVTVQLLHAKFERGFNDLARYRGPQYKKMTIDMEEPFVWPDLPPEANTFKDIFENQSEVVESRNAIGSDKDKPTKAFDGLYEKPVLPNKFISKEFKKEAEIKMEKYNKSKASQDDKSLVNQYLGF